jgi:hypothetical protein
MKLEARNIMKTLLYILSIALVGCSQKNHLDSNITKKDPILRISSDLIEPDLDDNQSLQSSSSQTQTFNTNQNSDNENTIPSSKDEPLATKIEESSENNQNATESNEIKIAVESPVNENVTPIDVLVIKEEHSETLQTQTPILEATSQESNETILVIQTPEASIPSDNTLVEKTQTDTKIDAPEIKETILAIETPVASSPSENTLVEKTQTDTKIDTPEIQETILVLETPKENPENLSPQIQTPLAETTPYENKTDICEQNGTNACTVSKDEANQNLGSNNTPDIKTPNIQENSCDTKTNCPVTIKETCTKEKKKDPCKSDKKWLVAFKPAYYYLTDSNMRRFFDDGGFTFRIETNYKFSKYFAIWLDGGYFQKEGNAFSGPYDYKLKLGTVTLGLKAIYNFNDYIATYVGAGPRLFMLLMHNSSPHVRSEDNQVGIGGGFDGGFLIYPFKSSPNFYFDLFADYSCKNMSLEEDEISSKDFNVDVSGVTLGLGIGVRF